MDQVLRVTVTDTDGNVYSKDFGMNTDRQMAVGWAVKSLEISEYLNPQKIDSVKVSKVTGSLDRSSLTIVRSRDGEVF